MRIPKCPQFFIRSGNDRRICSKADQYCEDLQHIGLKRKPVRVPAAFVFPGRPSLITIPTTSPSSVGFSEVSLSASCGR